MAVKRPIVHAGGRLKELPAGDTLLAPAVDQGNGFVSWTGEATVTSSTSVALLDSTGAALSPTKTYKVAACNIDSSAQRGAVALFVGDGSDFALKTVYEQGTVSSNVRLYLNAGVPSVSVYGGSGPYRIPYLIEEVPNFGQGLSEFALVQKINDAPSDGKTYGRKDAMWVEAGGGGKALKQQVFKTSGTWVRPVGVNAVEVLLVGGGGGGGSGRSDICAGGGGGGEVIRQVLAVSGNQTVTIGAGGSGGAAGTISAGGAGGTSSFGSLLSCAGGSGGNAGSNPSEGGFGGGRGSGSGGSAYQINLASSPLVHCGSGGTGTDGYGGGGGAFVNGNYVGGGGSGSSGGGSGGWTAQAGAPNSGGGGGAGYPGKAGGSGICIVTWWE